MVELNTSIPLGVKVPEYNPLGDVADIVKLRTAQQQQQANALALDENRRKLQEQEGLRNLLAGGADPTSPDFARQAYMIAPNLGPTFMKTVFESQKENRAAAAAKTDLAVKNLGYAQSLMPSISDQAQLDKFRGYVNENLPEVLHYLPTTYAEFDAKRPELMKTAAQSITNHFFQQEGTDASGQPVTTMYRTNMYGPAQTPQAVVSTNKPFELKTNTDATGAVSGINPYTNTAAPTMMNVGPTGRPAPLSQTFDPAAYDATMRKAEGTGKNPMSSAQGDYQFIDSTFINMFKKVFPEAKGMSDREILAQRGAKLPNGQTVESILGPAYTSENVQYLQSKGLPVTGATAYLAHFLGAGGAEKLLKADPNTPVSQVVSPAAIAANPKILGNGKTVGQVQQWAADLIDRMGGTIGVASGGLPAFAQPGVQQGTVTAGGYTPPQVGMNALAPQQQAAVQNALLAQNQPTPLQLTPYQMPVNRAAAQPVAPVAPTQLGAGTKAAGEYETTLARKTAETAATKSEQAQGAKEVLDLIGFRPDGGTRVDDLIKQSTSGPLQTLGAGAARMAGYATPGQQALAQLKTLSDSLTVQLLGGKLGAGISEGDRQAITRSLGNISDESQPASARLASWEEAKRRLAQLAGAPMPSSGVRSTTGGSAYSKMSDAEIKAKLGL